MLEVALALVVAEDVAAGVEEELELLLLQAAASSAAETAAAVRPALLADTEYNGVPRLFRSRHAYRACARSDPYGPVSIDPDAYDGKSCDRDEKRSYWHFCEAFK
jgi:hypothetical protein